ncbi:MAG: hypothetical protein DCC59_10625, partial [Chloroflexi bacterium]
MSLWAILPVKPLRRGKSRLAGALTEDERAALNEELLERTLRTLSGLKELEKILVVSRDPHALTIARNHGAKTVQEDGQPHLNTALTRASVVAQVHATQGVLVLPVDLPFPEADGVELRQVAHRAVVATNAEEEALLIHA